MFIETEQLREKINHKISFLSHEDSNTQTWMTAKYNEYLKAVDLVEIAEQEIFSFKYKNCTKR